MKSFAKDTILKILNFIQFILLYISWPLLVVLIVLALFTFFIEDDIKSTILLVILWLVVMAVRYGSDRFIDYAERKLSKR